MDQQEATKFVKSLNPNAAKRAIIAAAPVLDGLAVQVWCFGLAKGARRAVAIVAQMGAELAMGASQLYKAKRWYAGAALVRQLIEVEYLLFLFASDPAEPERWPNSPSEQARHEFSPRRMRERSKGRFRVEEYAMHCEMGGHPRLRGHVLLQEHLTLLLGKDRELLDPSVQWVDLAQHLERLCAHYIHAVAIHSPTNVYPDRFKRLVKVFATWHKTDPNVPEI